MKKHFVLLMILAGIILFLTEATTAFPKGEGRTITETDPIDLTGEFKTGGLRSGGDAITAEVQGSTIVATFHKDLGNVFVTLTDIMGDQVYVAVVNTSIQSQAFVPLSGLPSGIYTITFSNDLGAMYGNFEI